MIALRLVIDTNIVVSAALKPDGLQRTVLLLAMTKPARLYVSEAIMDEYREVLARPRMNIRKGLRQQLLQLINSHAHSVTPARTLQVARDPDDNKFLECADAARADYLVTGNQRHFPRFWKRTTVITSREFIGIVTPHLITGGEGRRARIWSQASAEQPIASPARRGGCAEFRPIPSSLRKPPHKAAA